MGVFSCFQKPREEEDKSFELEMQMEASEEKLRGRLSNKTSTQKKKPSKQMAKPSKQKRKPTTAAMLVPLNIVLPTIPSGEMSLRRFRQLFR